MKLATPLTMSALLVFTIIIFQLGNAQSTSFEKGKAALASRDTAAAITAFQEAIRNNQKSGNANYYLGQIAFDQGRVDDAVNFLNSAVRIDDENLDALMTLGDAYVAKKDNAKALDQFKRAAKLAPKDCRVPLRYGAALVEAGVLDGAEGAFVQLKRAEDCDPKNPLILIAQGDAYKGIPAVAITYYEKAMGLAPNDLSTLMKMARAFAASRKWTEAVQAFTKAVQIDTTNYDAYMEAGKILLRAKQYARSAQFLDKAYKLRPNNTEAVSSYAQALAGAELWVNAAKVAEQAVKLDSNNVDNWRAYAQALAETRDYNGALNAYQRVMKRSAMKGEDTAKVAKAYFNTQQEEKALALYLEVIRKDSANCDPYYDMGFIYMKKQRWADAAAMFERKIACDPRSLNAYLNAGMCNMQPPENLPRARELFVKAIELKPDYLQSKLWLARYYGKVDSTAKMRDVYDDVIRLANQDPAKNKSILGEAYSQLGSGAMQAKNYSSALEYFRKALSSGESAGLNLAVGQCIILTLSDNGDNRSRIEDAVAKFRRCVALEPGNAGGHYWLGDALLRLRDPADPMKNRQLSADACAEFVKALKLDPRNENAKKAMERVGCK